MGRRNRLADELVDVEKATTLRSGFADWDHCPKCGSSWVREPAMNHCRHCGLTVANGGRIAEQIRFERQWGLAEHHVDQNEGANADRQRAEAAQKMELWENIWRRSPSRAS